MTNEEIDPAVPVMPRGTSTDAVRSDGGAPTRYDDADGDAPSRYDDSDAEAPLVPEV